jgi:hypothetical protein
MRYFLFSFLFFSTVLLQAQYTKSEAKEDLLQLKQGTLLVRLKTSQAAIAALESRGRNKEAERIKERLYRENKEILLSFTNAFDFCNVYFFYAPSSEKIRNKEFEGYVFSANRLPVPADSIKGPIYTAEFSETENLGIKGLILMDENMFPLKAPFPFYQRKYTALGLVAHSKGKMVELFNKRLHSTYKLWFSDEEAAEDSIR